MPSLSSYVRPFLRSQPPHRLPLFAPPFPKHFTAPQHRWFTTAVPDVQQWMQDNNVTCSGGTFPPPILNFQDGQWPAAIMKAIQAQRLEKPTTIQAATWAIVQQGHDMIGIAETGSGKTLGFALPCLMKALAAPCRPADGPTGVVVCPTRELAQQTYELFRQLMRGTGLRAACVVGGTKKQLQVGPLEAGVDVIVCTPGRMIDVLETGTTTLERCAYLVLDEADRMLDMGFEDQIRMIIQSCPETRQTLMWSATWPPDVRQLAGEFMKASIRVNIGSEDLSANKHITQHVICCSPVEKMRQLRELLTGPLRRKKILVFANAKLSVDSLARNVTNFGVRALSIHGGKTQAGREAALSEFKHEKELLMVATDVAARGIDVRDIDVVINYDMPTAIDDYIHRIGRTGRAGAHGEAYTLFTQDDARLAASLIRIIQQAGQQPPADLQALVSAAPASARKGWRGAAPPQGARRAVPRLNSGASFWDNAPDYGRDRDAGARPGRFGRHDDRDAGARPSRFGRPSRRDPDDDLFNY